MSMRFLIPLLSLSFLLSWFPAISSAAPAGKKAAEPDWREDPKTPAVATWLARRIVAAQVNGQPEIARQLSELLKAGGVEDECAADGVFYFPKRESKQKAAAIYRRKGWTGSDERLPIAGKDRELVIFDIAKDNSLLVFGARTGKDAETTVRVFDLARQTELPDTLPPARYQTVTLGPDKKGVWYARVEAAGTKVFFHTFGTGAGADKMVFGESYFYEPLGPKDLISTALTESGEHLLLTVRRGNEAKRVDVYAQELEQPDERIRPIIHAMDNEFALASHEEDLFVLTDNEAPKKRVVQVKINDPSPLNWKTIIPEGAEALGEIELVGETLFVSAEKAGTVQTRLFTLAGKEIGQLTTPAAKLPQRVWHACPHE